MGKTGRRRESIRSDLHLLAKKSIHFDRAILEYFV